MLHHLSKIGEAFSLIIDSWSNLIKERRNLRRLSRQEIILKERLAWMNHCVDVMTRHREKSDPVSVQFSQRVWEIMSAMQNAPIDYQNVSRSEHRKIEPTRWKALFHDEKSIVSNSDPEIHQKVIELLRMAALDISYKIIYEDVSK